LYSNGDLTGVGMVVDFSWQYCHSSCFKLGFS